MQTEYPHQLKSNLTFHHPPVALQETRHVGQKGSWQWDMKTDIMTWSEHLYRIAGCDPHIAIPSFRQHSVFYTAESWDRLTVAVLEVFKTGVPYELELQMRRPDGTTRWIIGRGEAVRDASNDILQLRGTVEDISEHKLGLGTQREWAVQTAANIGHWTKRLIDAHEEEKARISRELRDDICQSLSLLAVEIQRLVPAFPEFMAEGQTRIHELWQQTVATIDLINRVSRDLRPAVLDFVELAVAIRGLCRDFSKQCKIQAQCSAKVPARLDKRLALSFFRICQESLRNISKHSGAKNVRIELTVSSEDLLLCVSDDGVGFELEKATCATGFGFVRMEEQLHLIGGELAVWSQPSFGTRLEARAPLTEAVLESDAA
jgi:signal transduction histidine kinase